jgi:tetratricopeptide (TPR) repeat protein
MEDRKRNANSRSFNIDHGKLSLSVPYKLFRGRTAVLDRDQVSGFRSLLSSRYPWLSENALDEILEKARKERERQIVEEKSSGRRARELMERGEIENALRILDHHLESCPEDPDALYVKGEALCRLGRSEEGYRCISAARKYSLNPSIDQKMR